MAKCASSKLLFFSLTLIGIMYQVYIVDGLKCIACVPKKEVDSASKSMADTLRSEIVGTYGTNVKECGSTSEWEAEAPQNASYPKDCTVPNPFCYTYKTDNWSARTCRSGTNRKTDCNFSGNIYDCYCNNADNCNVNSGISYSGSSSSLRCIVCVPKSTKVDTASQYEADTFRTEITAKFDSNVKECDNTSQWETQALSDQSYSRTCTGSNQWCYTHNSGNWSARTCRGGTTIKSGCVNNGTKSDCYCNNTNNCNSKTEFNTSRRSCIICLPKSYKVDAASKIEADKFRNEIINMFGNVVKECDNTSQWETDASSDPAYSKTCPETNQWCYTHKTGNWSARTCRGGTTLKAGCVNDGNKSDCYCNNTDNCNLKTAFNFSGGSNGLRCIVCVPKESMVDTASKSEADKFRNDIIRTYGPNVPECNDTQSEAQVLANSSYTKNCSEMMHQWCYIHKAGNWSARTCLSSSTFKAGCTNEGNKYDCYCKNKDNCNSATDLKAIQLSMKASLRSHSTSLCKSTHSYIYAFVFFFIFF